MQDKLATLYKQMEMELNHLNQKEKQVIRRYMAWAFERGESNIINRLKTR